MTAQPLESSFQPAPTLRPSAWRRWTTALRPFAYPASLMGVLLGTVMAQAAGYPIRWGRLTLVALGVAAWHTTANLFNDVADFRSGLDRRVQPNSGAIVRGWISQQQALTVANCCLALGVLCGVWLTVLAGWTVPLLAIPGIVCTLAYSAPRYGFKISGWGDAAIFLAFGLLPVAGAWWVQAQTWTVGPWLWSLPLACTTVGILHGNNWRDLESDRAHGCRTIASRLGPSGSRRYYQALVLAPFGLSALFIALNRRSELRGLAPPLAPIILLALPLAIRLARINPQTDQSALDKLDARTARLHLAFGLLSAAAFSLPF